MAKVDIQTLFFGITVVAAVASALFFLSRRFLRLFALFVLFFLALEIFLLKMPEVRPPSFFARDLWWKVHFPSVELLGPRGGLLQAGRVMSTLWHLCDLIAWALVSTFAIRLGGWFKSRNDRQGNSNDSDGDVATAPRIQARPTGVGGTLSR